ncbi:MAG: hypothetical protein ITG04_09190 [Proteiniphilum sp.]|nr:hypothetical protein [Proteiniphilum sp.]
MKNKIMRVRSLLLVAILLVQSSLALIQESTASAAPTFTDYPISATYKKPGTMTTAGGDLWYLQSTNSTVASDSIGRMSTSGVTTDYAIGYPSGQTSFTVAEMITGPDGNIWMIGGGNSGGVYLGKLDISTGAVTFYTSGVTAYSGGRIAAGSDGNIYYSVKTGASPAKTYLRSMDPATGVTAAVQDYDIYTNIYDMATGPDGRLYISDAYYNRIYALPISGGTSDIFYLPASAGSFISGPDGNVWYTMSGKIVKMTTTGARTEYILPSGVKSHSLVAGPDGAVWFVDNTYNAPKIGRITITGIVTTYAIPGTGVRDVAGPVLGSDGAIWFDYQQTPSGAANVGRLTAAPTFTDYPISATYKKPGTMTTAGGDLWYLQSTNSTVASDSIGRMSTSGVTTDYAIGYPSGQTSFTVAEMITGPDGNIWMIGGGNSGGVYLGKLDISTGAVTFYTSGVTAYSGGRIAAGSDGNIYYSVKTGASPAKTYLRSMDPATGVTAAVQDYDIYTNIYDMATGPDGRLYISDAYYNRIYALPISGGTSDIFYLPASAGSFISGPDGNVWYTMSGKIVKMTTTGARTEYILPSGVKSHSLVAGPDGAVWFVDNTYNAPKIGRITITGIVTTYAIPGTGVRDVAGPVLGSDGAIWFDYQQTPSGAANVGRLGY